MVDLTNLEEIKKLDPQDVYGSTGMLADQCKQIWQDGKQVQFPDAYKHIENIVICGMGGSAYGGHVVKAMFKEQIPVPLYINSDYTLPGFVNEKTLVILTSYSGSTEETLANAEKAQEKGAQITVLTSGGKLAEFATTHSLPALIFNPQFNPSGQPRLGTGYIILGTIVLLNQLGLISLSDEDVTHAIEELQANAEQIKQQAITFAKQLEGYIPVIMAAEFLEGNAHIMRNQFNETSKSFSAFSDLPELNHHLLEGFKNPQDKKLLTIIMNSSFYSPKLKKRTMLTEDVLAKNNITSMVYEVTGNTPMAQMLNVLSFGGYITVYLAFVYQLNPSLIPWVDYFKAELAK